MNKYTVILFLMISIMSFLNASTESRKIVFAGICQNGYTMTCGDINIRILKKGQYYDGFVYIYIDGFYFLHNLRPLLRSRDKFDVETSVSKPENIESGKQITIKRTYSRNKKVVLLLNESIILNDDMSVVIEFDLIKRAKEVVEVNYHFNVPVYDFSDNAFYVKKGDERHNVAVPEKPEGNITLFTGSEICGIGINTLGNRMAELTIQPSADLISRTYNNKSFIKFIFTENKMIKGKSILRLKFNKREKKK